VIGLARKVGDTKPPSVAMPHTTTKSTKKPSPSSVRADALMGSSGANTRRRTGGAGSGDAARAGAAVIGGTCGKALLDIAGVEGGGVVFRCLADHAGLQQDG